MPSSLLQLAGSPQSGQLQSNHTLTMRFVTAVAIDVGRELELRLAYTHRIGALDADNGSAADRHALHEASLRIVIVQCVMLGGTVVPHGDGIRSPTMAELIFGNEGLMKERVE